MDGGKPRGRMHIVPLEESKIRKQFDLDQESLPIVLYAHAQWDKYVVPAPPSGNSNLSDNNDR